MVKKIINIGVEGNDATGDAIRDAFSKVNDNFNEIYFNLSGGETGGFPFTSLSDYDPDQNQSLVPESMFIVHPTQQLILAKKLVGELNDGAGIEIDNTNADRIIIKNLGSKLVQDTTPKLGGTLDGQGQFSIGNILAPDSEEAAIIAGRLNVSLDTFATTKGYTDATYVNINGDTMTGPLVVPADASGSQVPRKSEVVGRLGEATNAMLGDLLLYRDPLPTGSNLTAATKHYVDVNGTPSPLNFFVSTNGRTTAEMVYDGVPTEKFGRAYAYAFSSLNEACKYAEDAIFASTLEPGNYKQPITIGNATAFSVVNSLSSQTVDSKSVIRLAITNNNGTNPVDQGTTSNIDLIPGKLITGATSKAIGIIYSYRGVQSGYDEIDVIMRSGTFITTENLYFDSPTPKIQITINVESGIYDEHFPIRVPRNVSIIGDEMRRTIIRPKDAASASPWRTMYFYRDLLIDGVTTNPSLVLTNAGGYSAAAALILANKAFIQSEVNTYMYQTNTTFNQATSSRDIGYIVDALVADLSAGGNSNSVTTAYTYYGNVISSENVDTCIAGIKYIKQLIPLILAKTTLGPSTSPQKLGTVSQETSGTAGETGTSDIANKLVDTVVYGFTSGIGYHYLMDPTKPMDIGPGYAVFAGSINGTSLSITGEITGTVEAGQFLTGIGVPRTVKILYGSGTSWTISNPDDIEVSDTTLYAHANIGGFNNASVILSANKEFIKAEVNAYMTDVLSATYNTDLSLRDVGLVIDAICDDLIKGYSAGATDAAFRYYGTAIASENRETCYAGLNYIKQLIPSILSETELDETTTPPKRGEVDQINDPMINAESGASTIANKLVDIVAYALSGSATYNPPRNNKDIDLFLMNDATGLKDFSMQGHGGFAVVLDPEGQILTKSPYIQNCSSLSASLNKKAFRGGAFVDGFTGRMPITITTTTGSPLTQITVSGVNFPQARPLNGLVHRTPNTPTSFFINGQRYRINNLAAFDDVAGTATFNLGDTYSAANTGITLETAGNRSMLATHFTQVNDLGYGILATNNALMELVSVFTYYNHTAYYALNGAQIRSVSGSNSNGFFGLKAEGSDPNEIPRSVYLADNTSQVARVYKKGSLYNSSSYNASNGSLLTIVGYDYVPYSTSELQINHATAGRTSYTINNVTPVANTANIKTIAKGGNGNGIITTTVSHGFSTQAASGTPTQTSVTGSSGGYTLTISNAVDLTTIYQGQMVAGTNIGVTTSFTGTIASGTLTTLTTTGNPNLRAGQLVSNGAILNGGTGITHGIYIVSGSGNTWTITNPNGVTFTSASRVAQLFPKVVSVKENVVTLDVANSGTVSGLATFYDCVTITNAPSTVVSSGLTLNTAEFNGTFPVLATGPGSTNATAAFNSVANPGAVVISFTGSISTGTLTVTNSSITYGAIAVGMRIVGGAALFSDNIIVTSAGTVGTTTTTWNITNTNNRTVASIALTGYANGDVGQNSFSVISSTAAISVTINNTLSRTNSGTIYIIETQGDVNWSSIGSSSNSPGTAFIYNGNPVTGSGSAYQSPIFPGQIVSSNNSSFGNTTTTTYVNYVTTQGFSRDAVTGYVTATVTVNTPFVSTASGTFKFTPENAGTVFYIPVSIGTFGASTTTSATATLNTKIAKISLGTGIDGTSTKFSDNINDGDWVVIRTAQNFKFYGNFTDLSARPSTSLDFTYDNDISTYRTINLTSSYYDNTKLPIDTGYGNAATLNEQPSIGNTVIVNVDTGFAYITAVVASIDALGGATSIRIAELSSPSDQVRIIGMEFAWSDQNTTAKGFKRTVTAYTATSPGVYATLTLDSALPTNAKIPTGTSISFGIKSYGSSTLATNIASTGAVSTITLASNASFSNNGSYNRYIRIDDEIFSFNGTSGSTILTGVVRARLGTVAAAHTTPATVREISGLLTANISTNRVTSHDFLNIGTGGFNTSNYPNSIYGIPIEAKVDNASSVDSKGSNAKAEVQEKNKGRVFFASTNQDGFFRVGKFFTVDQGTGTVSFNASIVLSGISGIGFKRGTFVAEFSPDGTMPDIGDAVPTNSAVRAYVDSRLGVDLNNTISSNIIGVGGGFLPLNPPAGVYMKSTLDMGSQKISRVATPVAGTDAPNKNYVDSALVSTNTTRVGVLAFKLAESGIGPTGNNLDINSNKIINLTGPTGPYDAANKAYVDGRAYIAQLSDVLVTTPTGPTGNDHFVYSGSSSKWVNARTAGDVLGALTATGPTGNTLTYTIQAGAIVDSKVSATAAIDHTKLALDNATASFSEAITITNVAAGSPSAGKVTLTFATPRQLDGTTVITGKSFVDGSRIVVAGISIAGFNGTYTVDSSTVDSGGTSTVVYVNATTGSPTFANATVRTLRGLVSLDANQFTISSGPTGPGWASIKTNGVKLDRLVPIAGYTVVGNSNSNATTPSATAFTSVVENSLSSSYSSTLGPTGALAVGAGVIVRGAGAGNFGTVAYGPTGAANTLVQRDANGDFAARNIAATSLSVTGPVTSAGLITSGKITRTAASTGYLDGNYMTGTGGETTATPGVIYTLGGTSSQPGGYTGFVPNATNLGNMYGIGYTYTNSGTARTTLNAGIGVGFQTSTTGLKIPDNKWGQYVAANGSVKVFLGEDGIIYGTAAQAQYADLAEDYAGDQQYEPGTVLMIGGEQEVTLAKGQGTRKVVGVVSTKPAYHMNRGLEAEFSIAVALQGRVPCKVIGKISKGDLMVVSMVPGVAMASEDPKAGSIIGKALADYDSDRVGVIEVLVGKH